MLVFAGGLRGLAVEVTVVEDAAVGWLAGLDVPGLLPLMRGLAALGSWLMMNVWLWGLLLALLVLRRLRQLLVVLLAWLLQAAMIYLLLAPLAQRPRPFGVTFRTDWTAWALPSEQMGALVVVLVGILYGLVPEGRWRQLGKWVATGLVALIALARMYLGVEAPTDILVGVAIGVAISLLGAHPALAALRLRAWAHALGFRGHWSTRSRRYSTTFTALRRARVIHAIRRRLRGAEPLDAWGRRASEEATVILSTWSFVGRGYSDHDSADLAVITAGRTREYPDAA